MKHRTSLFTPFVNHFKKNWWDTCTPKHYQFTKRTVLHKWRVKLVMFRKKRVFDQFFSNWFTNRNKFKFCVTTYCNSELWNSTVDCAKTQWLEDRQAKLVGGQRHQINVQLGTVLGPEQISFAFLVLVFAGIVVNIWMGAVLLLLMVVSMVSIGGLNGENQLYFLDFQPFWSVLFRIQSSVSILIGGSFLFARGGYCWSGNTVSIMINGLRLK